MCDWEIVSVLHNGCPLFRLPFNSSSVYLCEKWLAKGATYIDTWKFHAILPLLQIEACFLVMLFPAKCCVQVCDAILPVFVIIPEGTESSSAYMLCLIEVT